MVNKVTTVSNSNSTSPPALRAAQVPVQERLLSVPNIRLNYTIHACSGWTGQFAPENILTDNPNDQSSRWSSASTNQSHFITLKLSQISVLRLITFGKFYKSHVCNLKEFKVFAGMNENNLTEVLHGGLHNDNEPETFPLKYWQNDVASPCLFVKVVPISTWGGNFIYSIWYLELSGISDSPLISQICSQFSSYKETEAIRLCLKHLRQRDLIEPFEALQKKTRVSLEDPVLEKLFECLVKKGDFKESEKLLEKAKGSGFFNEYVEKCVYDVEWKRIFFSEADTKPSMRGGHQMVIDVSSKVIYLLGGWDGTKDLSDFWAYSISTGKWQCLSEDLRREGGPGPRSCHKICFDQVKKQLYVLGRYIDPDIRPTSNLDCDFFRYDVAKSTWEILSKDTKSEGGPQLMYDHQLVLDNEKECLYVFGGRTITATSQEMSYSGLYSYHIPTNKWNLIRSDSQQKPGSVQLKSRIGHSMLFNAKTRQLYIFAGQRNKDYLGDFYVYDIDSDEIIEMTHDSSKVGGPEPGFTQRATLDDSLGELFVLSGLMRERSTGAETFKNCFWLYRLSDRSWHKLYHNENTDPAYWTRMRDKEPCPRYAHQIVYDPIERVHYLFGGNPGESGNTRQRLDDFWKLSLKRSNSQQILQQCCGLVRKQIYKEMLLLKEDNSVKGLVNAVKYLQGNVSDFFKADRPELAKLSGYIFKPLEEILQSEADDTFQVVSSKNAFSTSVSEQRAVVNDLRLELFERLCKFFPQSMRQPDRDLINLVLT